MEGTTNPPTPMNVQQDDQENPGLSKAESTTMLCDPNENKVTKPPLKPLSVKDLLLLCQMFYLPADHGQFGLELLNEFYWLKRNGTAMLPIGNFYCTLSFPCPWHLDSMPIFNKKCQRTQAGGLFQTSRPLILLHKLIN